jgi:hypothetical protein
MICADVREAETMAEIGVLREEVAAWRDRWENDAAVDAHRTQLTRLSDVLDGVITDTEKWLREETGPAVGAGAVYEACRKADELTLHARRLWRWYADKIDLLQGEPATPAARMVRAADELIWSCWKTAWTRLGEGGLTVKPPAAPIPYIEATFAASATPRDHVPRDIKPGDDDELLKRHVDQLPITVIALPPGCARRPWWLIIAAHEAGHLVQDEMGLTEATACQLEAAALGASGGDRELADQWRTWGRELFADAFSVLLAGPAATWAISELEMRADLNYQPAKGISLYPPPLIRVAVANEVARLAGIPEYDPGFPLAARDDLVERLLPCVPGVAAALASLAGGSGRPLSSLGLEAAGAFQPGQRIAIWRDSLLGHRQPLTEHTLSAARLCASAGVAAWQLIADRGPNDLDWPAQANQLAGRLLGAIVDCGEDGTRATRPATADAGAPASGIARQIFADMVRDITA